MNATMIHFIIRIQKITIRHNVNNKVRTQLEFSKNMIRTQLEVTYYECKIVLIKSGCGTNCKIYTNNEVRFVRSSLFSGRSSKKYHLQGTLFNKHVMFYGEVSALRKEHFNYI